MRTLLNTLFQVAGCGCFVAGSGLLAVIDARTQLIPSKWLYLCVWSTTVPLVCAAAAANAWPRLAAALVSSGAAVAVFLLLHRFGDMGIGDVRLAGLLAFFLSWFSPPAAFAGLILGFLIGGLVGGFLLVSGRADRTRILPLGTCLVAGNWLALSVVAHRAR